MFAVASSDEDIPSVKVDMIRNDDATDLHSLGYHREKIGTMPSFAQYSAPSPLNLFQPSSKSSWLVGSG